MLTLLLLPCAAAQHEIDVSLSKSEIPIGVAQFVYACAGTGTLVNAMLDKRPTDEWLTSGTDRRNGWNWWYDTTSVADPLDQTAVHQALLQRFVTAYNTPGIGPAGRWLDAKKPASSVEVITSHGVDLIRPTNTWHPGHTKAADDPSGAGPTPLWPDRCSITMPASGKLSITAALSECATTTTLDATTFQPDSKLTGHSNTASPGTPLTLTDLLQRASGAHGIQWTYVCGVDPPHDPLEVTSTLSVPRDLCVLAVNPRASIREAGRQLIDFTVAKHGPSQCFSRL